MYSIGETVVIKELCCWTDEDASVLTELLHGELGWTLLCWYMLDINKSASSYYLSTKATDGVKATSVSIRATGRLATARVTSALIIAEARRRFESLRCWLVGCLWCFGKSFQTSRREKGQWGWVRAWRRPPSAVRGGGMFLKRWPFERHGFLISMWGSQMLPLCFIVLFLMEMLRP